MFGPHFVLKSILNGLKLFKGGAVTTGACRLFQESTTVVTEEVVACCCATLPLFEFEGMASSGRLCPVEGGAG